MERRTIQLPATYWFARLFFAGCVAGGLVAAAYSFARDFGVPIAAELLVAALLSPPFPPPSAFAAIAVFVAVSGMAALVYGLVFRKLSRGGSAAAGVALALVQMVVAGIAAGTTPLWHPHIPPLAPPGFFYASAGAAGILLFVAGHVAFGAIVGWTARTRIGS